MKIYGSFKIKFRAFGIDFGTAKQDIPLADAVTLPVAIPNLPISVPIKFDYRGISVDAYLIKA